MGRRSPGKAPITGASYHRRTYNSATGNPILRPWVRIGQSGKLHSYALLPRRHAQASKPSILRFGQQPKNWSERGNQQGDDNEPLHAAYSTLKSSSKRDNAGSPRTQCQTIELAYKATRQIHAPFFARVCQNTPYLPRWMLVTPECPKSSESFLPPTSPKMHAMLRNELERSPMR